MRASREDVDDLDLTKAVKESLKFGIDHFPPLVADECLSDAVDILSGAVGARLQQGYPLASEILGYPRKTFGVRPVVVASLGARSIYRALVGKVESWLAEPSRGEQKWAAHKAYGVTPEAAYIAEFDIASCYEYIDHDLLLEELVVKTGNVAVSRLITQYLSELQGRKVGLPQLSYDSDVLADTYLEILSRRLRRDLRETSRFADDFRVLASSYEDAISIIERSSEYARELGLVLSTEKTRIYRHETLKERNAADDRLLDKYFEDVNVAMAAARELMGGGYMDDSDDDSDEEDVDTEQVEFAVYHRILQEWLAAADPFGDDSTRAERLQGFLPRVLAVLRHDEVPINAIQLVIIFQDNISRIESVVKYIAARAGRADRFDPWGASPEDYWETIRYMSQMRRQTPWTKLWIIYAARVHPFVVGEDVRKVLLWLEEQIWDRHELVRAEAAWLLCAYGRPSMDARKIMELYQRATELTRPLLAACLARIDGCPRSAIAAIEEDGPLMKEAVKWARKK